MKQTFLIRVWLGAFMLLAVSTAPGQEPGHPLKPPDRSSPRAALKTFLDSGDAVGAFLARDYLPSPSRERFQRLVSLAAAVVEGLDLSEVPPAARKKSSGAAAMALYDTLNRIQLPPMDEIPGGEMATLPTGTNAMPNTEIALERVMSGPRSGEFLFSADAVTRAGDFYERVRGLTLTRPVPLENVREIVIEGGGWLIPYRWIQGMPGWLRAHLADQAAWKWIALILVLGLFALFLRVAFRLSRRGSPDHPFRQALAQLVLPVFVLLAAPTFAYPALLQINLFGGVAGAMRVWTPRGLKLPKPKSANGGKKAGCRFPISRLNRSNGCARRSFFHRQALPINPSARKECVILV